MNKKQDVRDKVREIKQRQQNWLKQRAESHQVLVLSKSETSPDQVTENSASRVALERESAGDRNGRHQLSGGQTLAQDLITSNKSKARFASWLKTKQSGADAAEGSDHEQQHNTVAPGRSYSHEKYTDNLYTDQHYRDHKGTGIVNVLKVPESRPSGFATPDTNWNSDDETGEITAATLLSPEDFDARANDIIAKVKGEIAMKNITTARNSPRPMTYGYHSVTSKPADTEPSPQGDQQLSSHVCPVCDKLMMPPSASPMLLIPCGHTLCSSCCVKSKFCAMCGCSVQSTMLNVMLQQIITNFHTKQMHRKSAHHSNMKERSQSNYKEEYQNLITRREILQEESKNISSNLEKLSRKLNKEQQQVTSIQRKEADTEREIVELQRKLAELREHRKEYEKQCYDWEVQMKQEKNRQILVQDSLTSIQEQIEKIQLLAEDDS